MKKTICAGLLVLCLLISLLPAPALAAKTPAWDGTVAESFAGGSGTEKKPYKIANGAQLAYLAELVNAGNEAYSAAHYALTADIDLGNIPWTPIGTKRLAYCEFKGNFDGGGHAVTGLFVDARGPEGYSDITYAALFGSVNCGTIRNLSVSGKVQSIGSNKPDAGGIAGYVGGTRIDSETGAESGSLISGCVFTGSVTVKAEGTDSNRANAYAGGIAASVGSASAVLNCRNNGEIRCESSHQVYAGGIAGQNSGQKTDRGTAVSHIQRFGRSGQAVKAFSMLSIRTLKEVPSKSEWWTSKKT